MPGKLNTKWHESHRMPPRATLDQRVRWHLAHAKACACRDMPAGIVAELKRRGHARADDVASRGTTIRRAVPVKTHGLTHVALAVRDPQRSLRFYQAVLGVVSVFDRDDLVQAQTPGSRDVLVFERKSRRVGKAGGVLHFGFRLRRARDIAKALAAIRAAGGKVRDHGEFVPGEPYVFFTDPDGYEVEIWYELPTPVDPPSRARS